MRTVPYPFQYAVASQVFQDVLAEVREQTGVATKYQAYTVLEAVFLTFRRRVTVQQSLSFADLLPAVLRAMYVFHWDLSLEPPERADRGELAREVKSLRSNHNAATESSIDDVARAIRRFVDQEALNEFLATLPSAAEQYWAG